MANMKELVPKGEFTVKTVGPSRDWEFTGNNGVVKMSTDSIQFEGHEQYWVDVNRAQDKEAPKVGDTLKGHIEQDEAGKYPPKFQKEKGQGGWGGGGGGRGASPGAIWSSAVDVATNVVVAYIQISGKKPKTMDEFLSRIEQTAPKVNAIVDRLAASNKPAEKPADTASSESGESPAPAAPAEKKADVVEDISDEELGDW